MSSYLLFHYRRGGRIVRKRGRERKGRKEEGRKSKPFSPNENISMTENEGGKVEPQGTSTLYLIRGHLSHIRSTSLT